MTNAPERIWACREGFQWKADFWSPSKTISSTEYVRTDLVALEVAENEAMREMLTKIAPPEPNILRRRMEQRCAIRDAVRAERDRITAVLDAHLNGSPGWLALQIRERRL